MMSNVKRVSKYLLIIAVVVASLRISIFSLRFFLGSEFPLIVVEPTGSMEPTYYGGDLLVVKGVEDKRSIKLLDIIVFHVPTDPNTLIVHRVIRIINDTHVEFETKGDHNTLSDYKYWGWLVRETDVAGVVIAKLPPVAGSIVAAVESQAMTVFTVVSIIVVIGVDIIDDRRERRGKTSL